MNGLGKFLLALFENVRPRNRIGRHVQRALAEPSEAELERLHWMTEHATLLP